MDFGLIADRDQIPEIWDLVAMLTRDLEAIKAAIAEETPAEQT